MTERTILVLNNDLLFKTKIQSVLNHEGYRSIWTTNEADAFSKLISDRPSLVILDLGLKEMDPIGFIERLKQTTDAPRVPVLAYASHVDKEIWHKARDAGADKVVARSEFSASLPKLIKDYASSS